MVNEAHLRAVLSEYAADCNAERPHRGLQLEPPLARRVDTPARAGPIRACSVLGGLHHVYARAA